MQFHRHRLWIVPRKMPQHSPIEEDLAQRTHGIGEEDINEGYRTGNARSQTKAAGVDQFEGPMEHRSTGVAYPNGRGDRQGYPNNDRAVECKYRTDGRTPNDIDPHDRR
mmetsp:Transcript_10355/g.18322  ORF Transcript_10355/g.18322 Transcript_10355/m.18322 type:complete len:109 (+) Transcript_10355:747-1073(+)